MSRKPIVVANWKMNHGVEDSLKFITEFAHGKLPENIDVVLCPPFTSLYTLSVTIGELNKVDLGAQNCHYESSGAYTGEISSDFLEEITCRYVILGHSERRHIFKESNKLLEKKIVHVLNRTPLKVIFCVGEQESERESGKTFEVIAEQLEVLKSIKHNETFKQLCVAYEPVWAIGTGKTATPALAQEVHQFIREWFRKEYSVTVSDSLQILYGGSVKPGNTAELMAKEDIDGLLVGGASLKASDFKDIITNAV
jgi:triosephosphate isomerase (TIM)